MSHFTEKITNLTVLQKFIPAEKRSISPMIEEKINH